MLIVDASLWPGARWFTAWKRLTTDPNSMRWRCLQMACLSLQNSLDLPGGVLALIGSGVREQAQADSLYADEPPAKQEIKVTAVPYYAWNNRGPGEMLVWVRRAS